MSTLVVFKLPGNLLVSCSLDKLSVLPHKGHCYLVNDQQYEVIQTIECLGAAGGNQQLLKLISIDSDDPAQQAAGLASIRSLEGDQPARVLQVQPERVLLVRLKALKKTRSTIDLSALAKTVQSRQDLAATGEEGGRKPSSRKRADK